MENFSWVDLVGYCASFVVLISFVMKEINLLRIVNIFGCALFVAYGILLNFALPIIITNVAIIAINLFYLAKKKK